MKKKTKILVGMMAIMVVGFLAITINIAKEDQRSECASETPTMKTCNIENMLAGDPPVMKF